MSTPFSKNLNELFDLAQQARRSAKSAREKWRHSLCNDERNKAFDAASARLNEMLAELQKRLAALDPGSITGRDIHAEIGDCYGVLGGLYRDWGRYRQAAEAYARGRDSEEALQKLGGKSNSYCMVQELVNLVMAGDDFSSQDSELRSRLNFANEEIRKQMKSDRREDPWAQADVAVTKQLLDPAGAAIEWDRFEDMQPPRFACSATHEVVSALFEQLKNRMPPKDVVFWTDALDRLV